MDDIDFFEKEVKNAIETIKKFNVFIINYFEKNYPKYSYIIEKIFSDNNYIEIFVCSKNSKIKLYSIILQIDTILYKFDICKAQIKDSVEVLHNNYILRKGN